MNLAIEYLVRKNRSRNLLSLPCSLFLTNSNSESVVITIQSSYGDNDKLIVKHWKLWESRKEDMLPPFVEYKIDKEEIFTNKHVIIKDCVMLSYVEEPFETGNKQYTDYPYSSIQSQEYNHIIESFYNSESHQMKRLDWLWKEFEKIHVPDNLRFSYGNDTKEKFVLQRDIINFYSKPIWNYWLFWCKYLALESNAAAELVFANEFISYL